MNKENEHNEEDEFLTPQQRARISLRFRAAKALLARKKPRFSTPSPSSSSMSHKTSNEIGFTCSNWISKGDRIPLMDLQTNSVSQSASVLSKTDNKHVNTPLLKPNFDDEFFDISTKRDNKYCTNETKTNTKTKTDIETTPDTSSFSTPINKQLQDSAFLSKNLCSPVSSVLDDDFDSSIFQEIDLLCEGSAAKLLEQEVKTSEDGTQISETNDGNDPILRSSSQTIATTRLENLQGVHGDNLQDLMDSVNTKETKKLSGMPESYSKFLESLNEDQLDAASTDVSTPLMVVAGPGSGKTSTMVGRVLMLLNQGIGPSHVLAMTFTTAAASEMRDRIAAVAGKEVAKELTISTFHSFSLHLCRAHADKLGRTTDFLIYGHGQQRKAVVEAIRLYESEGVIKNLDAHETTKSSDDVKIQNCKERSQKWQKFVTQAKASGKTPEECLQKGNQIGAAVLRFYNDILRSCNALDYHDLISCSVKLLTDYPEVLEECQALWKAIIVDEFQDTSSMQYGLLRLLVSHGQITVVGDDDQSIFSFNGADISGFDSFRKDFANHKEVRLKKNYRSTRCIVEAAAFLIQHNVKRCHMKQVITENSSGSKITLKECYTEAAQCAYVVDKILEAVLNSSETKCSFGNIAVLYRRQVSGRLFQATFRDRKIPFNVHGVAFYRKKIIKAILAMVKTTLPGCDDGSFRQSFKTLLPCDKEEKKKVIEHIDKISTIRKCSFISAASDIFNAKVSGTFKRSQLSQGRKVLLTIEMISKLVYREQSISSVITFIANLLPQKYLLEKRAVSNADGGTLLNEDNDLRSVLEYLLDDVTDFLSSQNVPRQDEVDSNMTNKGCIHVLQAFVDYLSEREKENFRCRRQDNQDSVTLTTIHQSKGLEWDIVFIVKVNDSEIPLLHEHNGTTRDDGNSIEEERRLFYVAMTRARKKLFILYVAMDSNWQVLHPSRFLKEIPAHLLEIQADLIVSENKVPPVTKLVESPVGIPTPSCKIGEALEHLGNIDSFCGDSFLKMFNVDDRGLVSRVFHQWAKKKAFQEPKRLLDKVHFVIDERLRTKKTNNKDLLATLKTLLKCDEAFSFAEYVIKWEQIPSEKRVHLMREKQMARLTARKSTARKRTGPNDNSPYSIRMRYGEDVCHFVHRLMLAILSYHMNERMGQSDYDTPERQAHILLYTLPSRGPLAAIRRKYSDVMINGRPNRSRYTHAGKWFLTPEFLQLAMVDATEEWRYNEDQESEGSSGSQMSYSPASDNEDPKREEEDPQEDEEDPQEPEE